MIKNLGFDIYAIIDEMPAGFAGHKLTEFKTGWVANFHHFGRLYTIDAVFDLERDIERYIDRYRKNFGKGFDGLILKITDMPELTVYDAYSF